MLPAANRLRSSRSFQRIYAEGATIEEQHVVLHVLDLADQVEDRLIGFAAGRRLGNAVARNRVKRRLREAVRSELPRIRRGVQLIVAARTGAARVPFPELAASVRRALSRAGLLTPGPAANRMTRGLADDDA